MRTPLKVIKDLLSRSPRGGPPPTRAEALASMLGRRPGYILEVYIYSGMELVEMHEYDALGGGITRADPQKLVKVVMGIKDFMQDSFNASGPTVELQMKSGLHVTAGLQDGYTVVAIAHGSSGAETTRKWLSAFAQKLAASSG